MNDSDKDFDGSSESAWEKRPSLTKWKKEPTLEELKQDMADAKTIHGTQVSKIDGWLDNLNVTGKAKVTAAKGNSSIVPKLIRKHAEWRYAALTEPFLSTDDIFNVRPVSWEDREAARQNELLLNNQFNTKIDKVRFIDEYVRTAVDEGTVIVQVGWRFEEEEYEAEEPIVEFRVNHEVQPLLEQLQQMQQISPNQFATDVPEELKRSLQMSMESGIPIEAVVTGYRKVTKTRTTHNHPTLDICDYRNLIIDPTCDGDIQKANFVVKTFESSKSELRKEGGRYKNLDKINVDANTILGAPDHVASRGDAQAFNFRDDPRKKFVVYEYWGYRDIDGSGVVKPIVAAWVGDTLIRLEESPFPDKGLPFELVQYLPVRKGIYGEPDGALLEDNQKVIGAVTRGMIDILGKSANGQTGIRKDMLDATNRRKYERGQDYEFNANVDPRQGVFMHTYPEIPMSAQFMLQQQSYEAESITGVKSWNQGVSGQALGDVAIGVRGALDASSKRELGILRRLSNGLIKVARKIIAMNAEFLTEEEVIRVTNEEFVTIRRDDLAGDFDLKLSISTAEEDNNKAEQLAFMFQTIGPSGDPELTKMILSDIARLRKMPDLAQKITAHQPQPDPLAQKMQELEIAKLEVEIQKLQAEAMRLQTDAQLNMAKAGTEQIKQGNIKSDTDLKNLDFVEQESGVKQERDLQKQGAQAQAQTQMKIAEHQMNLERDQNKHQTDLIKEYIKHKQT